MVTYSYISDKDVRLTPHFKVGEFRSYNDATKTLTTDKILLDEKLPIKLEELYNALDKKYSLKYIIVTSGYRSSDYEYYLSKSYNSFHVKGMAADIMCYKKDGSLIASKYVCMMAEDLGFNGIGYGENYTHVDVRSYKSYFDETNGKVGISSWYTYFNEERNIYYQIPTYSGVSIVDALKQINVDSSYSFRGKIANKNSILNYRGTVEQNTKMLSLLKTGKLLKP